MIAVVALPPPEPPIDGLKECAAFVGGLLGGVDVSTFAIWRAAKRARDPLPSVKVFGKRVFYPATVREWLARQAPAQLEMFVMR